MERELTVSARLSEMYERAGFCCAPPVYGSDEIALVNAAVDAVLRGEYETGVAPFHKHRPEHLTQPLVKIDMAQLANRTILSFLSDRRLGECAARVTGARRVQVWATQLLIKRPGTPTTGGVGWHRDETYWKFWTPDSELFTAWIALSEVGLEQGPVCMISGSHRWADAEGGNFFDGNLDAVKKAFAPPAPDAWRETPMLLPPGAVSFHHKRTIHGSYPNTSAVERRSFAVHMCTENARLRPDAKPSPYVAHLDDPCHAPVIWDSNP